MKIIGNFYCLSDWDYEKIDMVDIKHRLKLTEF